MKIEWSKITWYSKILALALFVLLPFAGFYLGTWYQKEITPTVVDKTTATSSAQKGASRDCGKVTTHGGNLPALDASANTVEGCFWKSYSNSTPASLILTYMGVDAGTTTYLTISDSNGSPVVGGYSQSYMAPKGNGEKDTFTCQKLTRDLNGLSAASCKFKSGSTSDILIPAFPPKSIADCPHGYSFEVVGPIVSGQPEKTACVPPGMAVPLAK